MRGDRKDYYRRFGLEQMKKACVLGLGQMGTGIARNLIKAGFPTSGYDIQADRRELLQRSGGQAADSCAAAAKGADCVFVMVLNGGQARQALLGVGGALETLAPGSTVIMTATILPSEVRALEDPLAAAGVRMVDSPVSGGKSGADDGTLTLMAAAPPSVLDECRHALEAISKVIHHVGTEIGQGQSTKASLQVLIGCVFAGTFEALVLGANTGVSGRKLFDVIMSSAAGSPLVETCARHVLDRAFTNTGSGIRTMHKDLGICLNLGRESGTPLFATGAAQQMFQAGISLFPDEDNWAVAKWLEEIAGAETGW